jgi:hypothetical protein
MNTILLRPTDLLFFRDGRPMSGSLAGHTAAWPLPDATNHALHAALHRAGLDGMHAHRRGRSGQYSDDRDRFFGSLVTAGPYPVHADGRWFFPRPKDAQDEGTVSVTLCPCSSLPRAGDEDPWLSSSLPAPLEYATVNSRPPAKETAAEPWLSGAAFAEYLRPSQNGSPIDAKAHCLRDHAIADTEAALGIAIDPETQTTGRGAAAGQIYSAHYLRLRESFRLGVLARADDKEFNHPQHGSDLIRALLQERPARIIVGGQQRVCTAELSSSPDLPLPRGVTSGFVRLANGKFAVKWVLLAPAVWPEIAAGTSARGTRTRSHPGGWLPNWVCAETGSVLLRTVSADERRRRRALNSAGRGYASDDNALAIDARLVAAVVPKPVVVTGWALPNATDRPDGGVKPTHLAVPSGAVYYFEADPDAAGGPGNALALANALNWHGATPGTEIRNRRSTLMGEKGFGLGVCGTWTFHAPR